MSASSVLVDRRPRAVAVGVVLALVAVVGAGYSLTLGDFPLSVGTVLRTFAGHGTRASEFVVYDLRLPRTLTALAVGAALGLAGAIFQSLSRNPLGSPDIIGFTTGSATGALAAIIVLGGGTLAVAAGAIGGGLLAAVTVYALAWRNGAARPHQLVLVGIGVSAVLASANGYLLTRADLGDAMQAAVWLTGSLNGRSWSHATPALLAVAAGTPLAIVLSRPLRVLTLGDDMAGALGVRVEPARRALMLLAVALTAVATAAAGPVPFIALAAPQIARRLARTPEPGPLLSALTGAALLTPADVAAQRLFAPAELPVGVLTAAVGGAYLVWLLVPRHRLR